MKLSSDRTDTSVKFSSLTSWTSRCGGGRGRWKWSVLYLIGPEKVLVVEDRRIEGFVWYVVLESWQTVQQQQHLVFSDDRRTAASTAGLWLADTLNQSGLWCSVNRLHVKTNSLIYFWKLIKTEVKCFRPTLQFHWNVWLLSWYVVCLSVMWAYCDKKTEVRIMQFSLKVSSSLHF